MNERGCSEKRKKFTRKLIIFLISIALIVPSTSISKEQLRTKEDDLELEELTTYNFPDGRVLEVDGVRYKAFTLEEYKEIAHILVAYETMWDNTDLLENEYISLEQEKKFWLARVEIWRHAHDVQKERGNLYYNLWKSEHKLRLKNESYHKLATWIPWTVVVLESIAIVTFGIYQVME